MARGNIVGLLGCAVVLVEFGSGSGLLFLGLPLWRPLRCARIAVVDRFVGGFVEFCAVEAPSSS